MKRQLVSILGLVCVALHLPAIAPGVFAHAGQPDCHYSVTAFRQPDGAGITLSTIDFAAVYSLAFFGTNDEPPLLYVGGRFDAAGGQPASSIATWDGTAWGTLTAPDGATGPDGRVRAMQVFDDGSGPALFVGGRFDWIGDLRVNNIAKWDGSEWSAIEVDGAIGLTGGGVECFHVYDDGSGAALYIGGSFSSAGGLGVQRIVKWNGTAWERIVTADGDIGVSSSVYAMATHDDGTGEKLYVGGNFAVAGNTVVNRIAAWDGESWSALAGTGGIGTERAVRAIQSFDDGSGATLIVGGQFRRAGGVLVNYIANWDGEEWLPLGFGIAVGEVADLEVFDDGNGPALLVGGAFNVAGGIGTGPVARWDGQQWSRANGEPGNWLTESDGARFAACFAAIPPSLGYGLIIGGAFEDACSFRANNILRWSCEETLPCGADQDYDGQIGLGDLNIVLSSLERNTYCGDANLDGRVDLGDLNYVLARFGTTCP